MSSAPGPRRNGHAGNGNAGNGNAGGANGNAGNGNGRHARTKGTRASEPSAAEFWRIPPKSAVPSPITPAADPTALLRSLGRPPLDQNGADRYLAAVAERAAGLATALAVAAGIYAPGADE